MQIIKLTEKVSVHASDDISYEEQLLLNKIISTFKPNKKGVTLEIITEYTCKYFNCTYEEMKTGGNMTKYSSARQAICILFLHYKLSYSMQSIAQYLGRKSHALIHNAKKNENKKPMCNYISDIKKLIETSNQQNHVDTNISEC